MSTDIYIINFPEELFFSFKMLFFYLCVFIVKSVVLRKWDPKDLAEQVPSWNFLNDPEELIPDKNLGPKINMNYLKINHVYDKTDVNFFIISDIIEKYVYHKNRFMEDLYSAMENHTEIDTTYKKKHHLFIVMIIKTKDLLIFPSSTELARLLPKNKVLQIQMELKKTLEGRNYAQSVYVTFDKLHHLWIKHSTFYKKTRKPSPTFDFLKDLLYIIPSVAILGLFVYVGFYYKRPKNNKND